MRRLAMCGALFVFGCSFVLLSDYGFLDEAQHAAIQAEYRIAAPASFRTSEMKGHRLHYQDGYLSAYLPYKINEHNTLVPELGAYWINVDPGTSPYFREENSTFGVASLGWVSTGIERWRWVFAPGVAVQTAGPDPFIGTLLAWGRCAVAKRSGMHIGFYGTVGMGQIFIVPVIGADHWFNDHWQMVGVFPLEFSLAYHVNQHWMVFAEIESFGRPYRFPQRLQTGTGIYKNGMFEVYATTAQLGVSGGYPHIQFELAGGSTLGGWVMLQTRHNHHGIYLKYNAAPYVKAALTTAF